MSFQLKSGMPARTQGRGARLPLKAHLCIGMFLYRGKFWPLDPTVFSILILQLYLEELESGGFPPEKYFPHASCLQRLKVSPYKKDRRDGKRSA